MKKTTSERPAAEPREQNDAAAGKKHASSTAATMARGTVAGAVASVGRALGADEPDAIELLEREHRQLEALLSEGDETGEGARNARGDLLGRLTALLEAHERMEEKVLYPALKSHPQARDSVLEGYEEHHVADLLVEELHEVATNDEVWGAKFKVLKENIEHHIEEEEGEMFRLARGIFSRDELRELAARMLAVRG